MKLQLSGEEYVEFLKKPTTQTTEIVVHTPCELPIWVTRLPDIPTVFANELNAENAQLVEFNHRVKGIAKFGKALKTLGPNAKLRIANLAGTQITELDLKLIELDISNCRHFRKFGPAASIAAITLDSTQVHLLRQLTKLPSGIRFEAANNNGLEAIDNCCHAGVFTRYPSNTQAFAQAFLDYDQLVRSPPDQLLESYPKLATIGDALLKIFEPNRQTKQQSTAVRALVKDAEDRLVQVAQCIVRSRIEKSKSRSQN